MKRSERLAGYRRVADALAISSDVQLTAMLDRSTPVGSGIGGRTFHLDVAGVPVFAKCVPTTDRELEPQHRGSTANLFGLPAFTHYGVGSAGGGAWRELAAHVLTTNWVLTDWLGCFPLLYHWRLLPLRTTITPDEGWGDIDDLVKYWEGSPAVRARLEAIADARWSLVLVLEHVAWNLDEWLSRQFEAGHADAAVEFAERHLLDGVAGMNGHGLTHFDTHLGNVLTDGEQLYLSDFGLAASIDFDLDDAERAFLIANRSHDSAYAATVLVNFVVSRHLGAPGPAQRNEFVRRVAAGASPAGLSPALSAIVRRHAPAAVEVNDFYRKLFGESRSTPYPTAAVEELVYDHPPGASSG